jgi:hypothetical protein
MKRRNLWSVTGVVAAAAVVCVASTTIYGQTAAQGKAYTAPRTVDGQPDLQGIWDFRTVTPLERPAELAGKEVLTEAEAADFETKFVASRDADANRKKETRRVVNGTEETEDVALAYNNFWWDRGTKVIGDRRTSLILDPKDGKIPALTPEGQKRADEVAKVRERPAYGPEDRAVGERCIMGFNAGPPMNPGAYNMNVQIVQNKDYVVLLNEMVHNARIVPLDSRPRTDIRQWSGESRARWEGNTLIVETYGFYKEVSLANSSPNLKVVERFTRAAPDVLLYNYTVSDPTTWTKPWTAEIPMRRTVGPIYEYACHEGNYGMFGILDGARAVDKREVDAAKKGSN